MNQQLKDNTPVKFAGPGAFSLPIGVFTAKTRVEQIDYLYAVADDPTTTRVRSEMLSRTAAKLMETLVLDMTAVS